MKIYIAGKISGLNREDVTKRFEAAQSVLPAYDEVSHEDYLHVCYAMIDICEAVYMLSDWQQSKGARMELQYAADYRKEILYEDPTTKEMNFPIIYGHPKEKASATGLFSSHK